jgi:hypothetical protein
MGQEAIDFYADDLGYVLRKSNITEPVMESILLPDITGNITNTIWSFPPYHVRPYQFKVLPVAIIFAHR